MLPPSPQSSHQVSVTGRCCTLLPVISRRTGDATKKPKPELLPHQTQVACQTDALKAGSPLTHTQSCKACSALTWAKKLLSSPHQWLQLKCYILPAGFYTQQKDVATLSTPSVGQRLKTDVHRNLVIMSCFPLPSLDKVGTVQQQDAKSPREDK